MVRNANSGYVGWSMSERAAGAYDAGEQPWSKWTKSELVDAVCSAPDSVWQPEDLAQYSLEVLRTYFLNRSSWHHTSRYFNETSFYSVGSKHVITKDLQALNELSNELRQQHNEENIGCVVTFGRIRYQEWVGSRRNGRFKDFDEPCVFYKDWAYTPQGKKNVFGNHILGTTELTLDAENSGIYQCLFQSLPKSVQGNLGDGAIYQASCQDNLINTAIQAAKAASEAQGIASNLKMKEQVR